MGGALLTLSSAQVDRPGRVAGCPQFNNTSLHGAYGFSHDGVALTDSGGSTARGHEIVAVRRHGQCAQRGWDFQL
jgi:hypothetical protein